VRVWLQASLSRKASSRLMPQQLTMGEQEDEDVGGLVGYVSSID
jgi:hypothetical protein